MSYATRTYVKRTMGRLYGIVEGISIDCDINDKEIIALRNWVDSHEMMHEI